MRAYSSLTGILIEGETGHLRAVNTKSISARMTQLNMPSTKILALLAICTFGTTLHPAQAWAQGGGERSCANAAGTLDAALVRVAAERIDATLASVARSATALGDAYVRLARSPLTDGATSIEEWRARATTEKQATGYRSWPTSSSDPPAFQAPYPGYYTYQGTQLDQALVTDLERFQRFAPQLRTAFESFPFSWVYLTTANESMVIYPYLPLGHAIDNGTPTETPFYRAADFSARTVGWTPPYLDLAGAGLMITASYPVYDENALLGVMSRDITLKQLLENVLTRVKFNACARTLMVDANGLAIDATGTAYANEIDRVNTRAKAAVLHYRTSEGLARLGNPNAVKSDSETTNLIVEQVLASAGDREHSVRFQFQGQTILAAKVSSTGWWLILIRPADV